MFPTCHIFPIAHVWPRNSSSLHNQVPLCHTVWHQSSHCCLLCLLFPAQQWRWQGEKVVCWASGWFFLCCIDASIVLLQSKPPACAACTSSVQYWLRCFCLACRESTMCSMDGYLLWRQVCFVLMWLTADKQILASRDEGWLLVGERPSWGLPWGETGSEWGLHTFRLWSWSP